MVTAARKARRRGLTVVCAVLLLAVAPLAAERTDLVKLANGDQITGEIKRMERGRLKYKTDDMGTLYIEWDNIAYLRAAEFFEVDVATGEHYFGSLATAEGGKIDVVGDQGTVTLEPSSIVRIVPIKETRWGRVDGSIDFGFSFTQAQHAEQLTFNADATYRRPLFETGLEASSIITDQEDVDRAQRNTLNFRYLRYRGKRWFVMGGAQLQQNEELGLELRSLLGLSVGHYLIRTNRNLLSVASGLAVSDEQATGEVESQGSLEGLLALRYSTFTYDFPSTDLTVALTAFPSLSESGRLRVELEASLRREVLKDFYLSLSVFESYDSEPLDETAEKNDFGVVTSVGWSF